MTISEAIDSGLDALKKNPWHEQCKVVPRSDPEWTAGFAARYKQDIYRTRRIIDILQDHQAQTDYLWGVCCEEEYAAIEGRKPKLSPAISDILEDHQKEIDILKKEVAELKAKK